QHAAGGDLEPGGVEDLRADVRVQPDQLADPVGEQLRRGPVRRPAGEREAELLVLVGGGDVLVGVRLHPHGDPDQHLRPHPARASWLSRSISWKESSTIRPTPASRAAASSAVDLLLPWKPIRSGGNPAASATASSPPVQTSRFSPSSAMIRATARHRNALPA